MEGLRALCDVVERNSQLAEDTARLAPEVLEAAGRAGLWMLGAPSDAGGLETTLPELATVLSTVAEADATVAWHAMNSVGLATVAVALDEERRREVLGGGDRPFGYSGIATLAHARREDEGYRLTGRWPFMTGAADAAWALVSGILEEGRGPDGPPAVRRFIVPLDALEVDGNWAGASAMRGTGSHAVATPPHGVLVPGDLCLGLPAPMRVDRPLYRLPSQIVFVGSAPPICLGTLRRAVVGTVDLVRDKRSRLDGHAHGDEVRVQQAIADADAEHRCLSAGYWQVLEEIWACAVHSEPIAPEVRARFWSTLFLVVDRCREHVSRLFSVATSDAYSSRNPVERALRDLHAASAALESFQSLRWAAARVVLGHEPRHPMF